MPESKLEHLNRIVGERAPLLGHIQWSADAEAFKEGWFGRNPESAELAVEAVNALPGLLRCAYELRSLVATLEGTGCLESVGELEDAVAALSALDEGAADG